MALNVRAMAFLEILSICNCLTLAFIQPNHIAHFLKNL